MDRFLAKLGKGERSCLALFPGFISVCQVQYEIQHNQVMTVAEAREHGYRSRAVEPRGGGAYFWLSHAHTSRG